MKKIAVLVWILSTVLIVLSCLSFWKGFSLKNDYHLDEDYPSLNQHAYVGGDAYNYIINGTYFTGYSTIGSAAALGAVVLLCTGTILFMSPAKAVPPCSHVPAHEKRAVPPAYNVSVSYDPSKKKNDNSGFPSP